MILSHQMEVVELKVRLHCKDCEKNIRKVLSKIKGVTCVEIDVKLNKITVLGYIDKNVVIKTVRKTGRRAELWSSSSSSSSSTCRPKVKPRVFSCMNLPECVF